MLRAELRPAADARDALALSDKLERLIDLGQATPNDRKAAYHAVRQWREETAGYAYARGALAGRAAELKGLSALREIGEIERWAKISIELDPNFRRGVARRMLGTLYVLAPSSLLDSGDSEEGLEILEELLEQYPEDPETHLRVAEAYIQLSDPDPAHERLCFCLRERERLRPTEKRLLDGLVDEVGGKNGLECE